MRAGRAGSAMAASRSTKLAAARIGPTVWDEDGPMPILNSSNTLIMAHTAFRVVPAAARRAESRDRRPEGAIPARDPGSACGRPG